MLAEVRYLMPVSYQSKCFNLIFYKNDITLELLSVPEPLMNLPEVQKRSITILRDEVYY